MELREISFSGNSPYTEREWYSYCKEKLSLSTSTKKSRRTLIRTYVDCTELLANLTLEKNYIRSLQMKSILNYLIVQ